MLQVILTNFGGFNNLGPRSEFKLLTHCHWEEMGCYIRDIHMNISLVSGYSYFNSLLKWSNHYSDTPPTKTLPSHPHVNCSISYFRPMKLNFFPRRWPLDLSWSTFNKIAFTLSASLQERIEKELLISMICAICV